MPIAVRPFERRDRDQLTALINLHVAAVVPGISVSVNAVLSQLEREPGETVVDPWVAARRCLVAEVDRRMVAAALLHRFRDDADVGADYRGSGEVRWFVCLPEALDAGRRVLDAALTAMRHWGVASVGLDCALPAPACYGIPDTAPHLRQLAREGGFGEPTSTEVVLAARCADLVGEAEAAEPGIARSVGRLGTRFTLRASAGDDAGFVEVCQLGAEYSRSSGTERWADIGDLVVRDGDPARVQRVLLAAAARWLLRGGITGLLDYWGQDVDPPARLALVQAAGFERLVTNERGFARRL